MPAKPPPVTSQAGTRASMKHASPVTLLQSMLNGTASTGDMTDLYIIQLKPPHAFSVARY